MKRKWIITSALMALSVVAFSQNEWENFYRSDIIEINSRVQECHDEAQGMHKRLVFYQYKNLTDQALTLRFAKQLWYDEKCINCDNLSESRYEVRLEPNEIKEADCDNKHNKAFHTLDRMLNLDGPALSDFEFVEMEVIRD